MPASTDVLSDLDTDGLLQHALDVVRDNFSSEHLPQSIHDFLLPISVATCQGLFATTTMLAAAMPALTKYCFGRAVVSETITLGSASYSCGQAPERQEQAAQRSRNAVRILVPA